MPTKKDLKYNDAKETEIFYDIDGVHIFRVNTSNSKIFLEEGEKFDKGVLERVAKTEGICKVIYVVDKLPPLSAVLSFVERPFPNINIGIYAIVAPAETSILSKFIPIVSYGLNITGHKDKHIVKIFNHRYRDNLVEVFEWIDKTLAEKSPQRIQIPAQI